MNTTRDFKSYKGKKGMILRRNDRKMVDIAERVWHRGSVIQAPFNSLNFHLCIYHMYSLFNYKGIGSHQVHASGNALPFCSGVFTVVLVALKLVTSLVVVPA
jgi:hypothetical protein